MGVRGLWLGVALWVAAAPAAGLQRAERPGLWIVEPGEVVTWDGYADSAYLFGKLEGAPIYGRLSLSGPGFLAGEPKLGRYAGGFSVDVARRGPADGWRVENGEPVWRWPAVRLKEIRVSLDGKPYLTVRDLEPRSADFDVDFPYPIREFELVMVPTRGKVARVRVRMPSEVMRRGEGIDYRKGLYLPGIPHEGPLSRARMWWVYGWNCLTKPEHGRVRRVKAVLEQHEVLAPEGPVTIGEAILHQPVYEFLFGNSQIWFKLRPEGWLYRDMPFRVRMVCETDKGIRFERVFEHVIKANPHPSGGGARVAPY